MISRIFFAIYAVVMMASNATAVCPNSPTDDPQYSFVLDWNGSSAGSCAWLTKNSKNAAARISKYCARSGVKFACAGTCGNSDCSCSDEPVGGNAFTFTVDNTDNEVPCWWLDWKGQAHATTAYRRGKYCSNPGAASKIDQYCGSGCGWCADTQPDWMDQNDVTGWNTP